MDAERSRSIIIKHKSFMHSLRKITPNDLDALVKYANNSNVHLYTSNKFPYPYLKEHGEEFIEFATNNLMSDILVIDVDGEFIGGCGIHFKEDLQSKNAELGYWLAEPFWGKGIITSVIKQRIEDAFIKHKVHRLYASVFDENIASQKALLKCGFTLEAILKQAIYKNGKFYDDHIYSIINPNSST